MSARKPRLHGTGEPWKTFARAQAASRKAKRQMRNLTVDNPSNRAFNRRMSNYHASRILEGIGVDVSPEAVCRTGGVGAQERGCVGC